MALFRIVQGVITTAMNTANMGTAAEVIIPVEMDTRNTGAELLGIHSCMGDVAHREPCNYHKL